MNDKLSKKEAVEYSGLEEKIFENYFRSAEEFPCLIREKRRKYYFSKDVLNSWRESYKWRTVKLDFNDYKLCLDFALAQHFRGYVLSDWGTARQREFGQKITNWVKGQLAEVAVKIFFKAKFNLEIELDFALYDKIVPQDITAIIANGRKRAPKLGVGIKSSKPKSAYLVLSENEVIIPERKSDIYIFCRPNMPDDHLLRITRDKIIEIVKNQQHYSTYKNQIPYFENMFCEIVGWCRIDELEKVTSIPGQDFLGIRFVKKTGLLHKSKSDWENLISQL